MSDEELTVVIVGAGGVGKTAITVRLTEGEFDEEYNPTIEDNYRAEIEVDSENYAINILDTAGQEEYAVMRDQYWRTGDGFLIVYDITNKTSFEDISTFFERICQGKDVDNFPIVVCGNKCDLDDNRAVTKKDGGGMCDSHNWPFFETSAKDAINIEESFKALVKDILTYQKQMGDEEESSTDIKKKKKKKGLFGGLFKKKKKKK